MEENTLKWVTAAQKLDGYKLELTFNDNKKVIVDCTPIISKYKIFEPLREKSVFDNFNLDGWTVTWLNGKIDIAPEYLYEIGKAV